MSHGFDAHHDSSSNGDVRNAENGIVYGYIYIFRVRQVPWVQTGMDVQRVSKR